MSIQVKKSQIKNNILNKINPIENMIDLLSNVKPSILLHALFEATKFNKMDEYNKRNLLNILYQNSIIEKTDITNFLLEHDFRSYIGNTIDYLKKYDTDLKLASIPDHEIEKYFCRQLDNKNKSFRQTLIKYILDTTNE